MSYINSRRFVILSSNINTSNDVFDRLIDVKDSVTGEEGILLCSHMCNFPSNLVNQATLLAGCKPTSKWENDDRLALGFHPDHYIQWRVFAETNEIELYLTGGFINPEIHTEEVDDEPFLFTNLPLANTFFKPYESVYDYLDDENKYEPFSKSLIRLAKSVLLDRTTRQVTQETLNNFECLIHRLFNSGRIDAWTASVFPSSMLTRCLDRHVYVDRIHWQGDQSMFFDKQTWTVKVDKEMVEWINWGTFSDFFNGGSKKVGEEIVLESILVPYVDGGFTSKLSWSDDEYGAYCMLNSNSYNNYTQWGCIEFF
jgi:hypothetical protein